MINGPSAEHSVTIAVLLAITGSGTTVRHVTPPRR
jgi:hypothetical protein